MVKVNLPKISHFDTPKQETRTDITPKDVEKANKLAEKAELKKKIADCKARGGTWDDDTQTCILPMDLQIEQLKEDVRKDPTLLDKPTEEAKEPEKKIDRSVKFNPDGTVTVEGADNKPVTLSKEEYKVYLNEKRGKSLKAGAIGKTEGGIITSNVQQALEQPNQAQLQSQQLAGQLGQYQQLGVSPTGLDYGEVIAQGAMSAVPRALSYAVAAGGALAAAGTAAAPGIGTIAGGAIGAAAGFVAGLASGMISNIKSQRTDTTKAQKRVLDEGKQNLNDWAILAGTDPANRALYVRNFNMQLALINQAYRQMKLDTSRDVLKFESALPDLAEFESFYSLQGERDFLVARMQMSLGIPLDPDYNYQLQEMMLRKSNE